MGVKEIWRLLFAILLCFNSVVFSITDANDVAILEEFRNGLENPELLKWPKNNDPCGDPKWPHIYCYGNRVGQIQVQGMGLKGPLPQNFNQLSMLKNIGLQRNSFNGALPTFKGLSQLQFVYLDFNEFDSIPSDFFEGLTSLQVISLDSNQLNHTAGWMLPNAIESSTELINFSCSGCNLFGQIPDFMGKMPSLTALRLSTNSLSGEIPTSFSGSDVQILQLNNQGGDGLTGSIAILSSMVSLTDVWLHGNSFSGTIPENITSCASLATLILNDNKLTGVIPPDMSAMKKLQKLDVNNNNFVGPVPKLGIPRSSYTFDHNSFCQSDPGVPCSPEVDALLDFLGGVNYPLDLATSWSGNDPCSVHWSGVNCVSDKISVINLQNHNLSGIISPSIGKLDSLVHIRLGGNKLSGKIPTSLTSLKSLRMLNLSANNLEPPVPKFSSVVTLYIDHNPLLGSTPTPTPTPSSGENSSGEAPSKPSSSNTKETSSEGSKTPIVMAVIIPLVVGILIISLVIFYVYYRKKKNDTFISPSSIIVHPRYSTDLDCGVKILIAQNANKCFSESDLLSVTTSGSQVSSSGGKSTPSSQIFRSVTRNFSPDNEIGRGSFGVVYKGEMEDGTIIAVKRMVVAAVNSTAPDEFSSEIAVLSHVRHLNLVSLLDHTVESGERLLVYEYMPQGSLSKHLFQWNSLGLEPLSWKKRLNIALDVARGTEYLHNLAQKCFIHRDLKSSNILLDEKFRAKVSDFGLVKLSPDGEKSMATRLAGTFGYMAPEYAITGRVTTKADVYSFGVVLMELITGLKALDDNRPEETRHLAAWFPNTKPNKEKLMAAIDPTINPTEETIESICAVAELAGHCTAREPLQRPDMCHVVSVLCLMAVKWTPVSSELEENHGIELHQPLHESVKIWKSGDFSIGSSSLDDSKESISRRPFSESLTSLDCRVIKC